MNNKRKIEARIIIYSCPKCGGHLNKINGDVTICSKCKTSFYVEIIHKEPTWSSNPRLNNVVWFICDYHNKYTLTDIGKASEVIKRM